MGDERNIDELISVFSDQDYQVQEQVSDALAQMGSRAVEPLLGVFAEYITWDDYERSGNKQHRAEDTLIKIGEPAVERLIEVLNDDRWGLRFGAIWCLREIGDPRAIQPLIEILRIDDVNVACEVLDAMEKFGERVLESLIAALNHENRHVRSGTAFILGKMKDARAVPNLISALHDSDTEVRQSVIHAHGNIRDVRAVGPLTAALQDENADIRWSAAWTLGELGDGAAIHSLIPVLSDPDPEVREAARESLGKLGYEQ